jgi:replicative DNA helicase
MKQERAISLLDKKDEVLEESFISALFAHGPYLQKTGRIHKIIATVKPFMLTQSVNKMIYYSIVGVYNDKKSIDLISVSSKAREKYGKKYNGMHIAVAISQSANTSVSYDQIETIVRLIVKLYIQRKGIEFLYAGVEAIMDSNADPRDIFRRYADQFDVIDKTLQLETEDVSAMKHTLSLNEKVKNIKDGLEEPFQPTGFPQIDKLQNGLTATDLIIIAARPGMGKTALVLAMARNLAQKGIPVGIFSLEMKGTHLVGRLIASEANINAQLIRNPKEMNEVEYVKYLTASAKISKLPLHIVDDTKYLNAILLQARSLVVNKKVKVIIVDYLQLVQTMTKHGMREQEISEISRSFKALGMDLNVPVIALSQLSRAVESRGGEKIPQLSDLRESGAIEQDADIVAFAYRPEYYKIFQDEAGNSLVGAMRYIVAKNRHGPLDHVYLHFNKYTTNVVPNEVKSIETHRPNEKDDTTPF